MADADFDRDAWVARVATNGLNELAMVRSKDVNANSGKAYPTTPGHYDLFSCAP